MKNEENIQIINNLTKELSRSKHFDDNSREVEKELEDKAHYHEVIKKQACKLDDNSFCNSQIALQNYLTLENKYNSLRDDYIVIQKKNEKLNSKIDSQNNVIKELKKVHKLLIIN